MPPNPLCFWTSMNVFRISLLTTLVLPHQTTSAGVTKEVFGVLGGSVTFHSPNADGNAALWSFGNDPIVTVPLSDPFKVIFHKEEFEARFAVSEGGRTLSISRLRMEDAGTYSVKIKRKTSTFILRVLRELAEPTVTCEAQKCSDGSCSSSLRCSVPGEGFGDVAYTWRVRGQLLAEGPVLLVNESLSDKLELLTCTAQNPVSSRRVTVTSPGALCAAIPTHPPSPGAKSNSWITPVAVVGVLFVVCLVVVVMVLCFCKSSEFSTPTTARRRSIRMEPADVAAAVIQREV